MAGTWYFDRLSGVNFGTLTGAWDTTLAYWTTDATGTSAAVAHTFDNTETAAFGSASGTATAGTATISNDITVTLNAISTAALAGQQVIASAGTGALTLAGTTPTINVGSAGGLLLSSKLSGSAGFTRSGTGTLYITNTANTISGSISILPGSGLTYFGTITSTSANVIPNITSLSIPASCFVVYGKSTTFNSNTTYSGDGVLVLSPSASGVLTETYITMPAGALVNLTGYGAPAASKQATAGLQIGNASSGTYATVRDFPRLITYYVNSYLNFAHGQVLVASDAVGGTYNTTINYNVHDLSRPPTVGLYANQANGNGGINLTGGFTCAAGLGNYAFQLGGTNNDNNELSGPITNGTGTSTFAKVGVGRWIFSNASNTYTGTTTISAGTLVAAASSAFGTGNVIVAASSTAEICGNSTLPNNFTSVQGAGDSSNGAIHNAAGNNTLSGVITLAATATIKTAASTTLTLSGALAGSNTLNKTGTGILKLTSTGSTGTGATNVNEGTLFINTVSPTVLPTGLLTVATGATLAAHTGAGGRGVIPGDFTLNANSTLLFGAAA